MKTLSCSPLRYLVALCMAVLFNTTMYVSPANASDDDSKAPTKSMLANSQWVLVRTQQDGFLLHPGNERKFTFKFSDSTLFIASYCNNINAKFCTSSDCKVLFSGLNLTQRLCSSQAMNAESEYMDLLKRITAYEFSASDNKLRFYIGKDLVMVLVKE